MTNLLIRHARHADLSAMQTIIQTTPCDWNSTQLADCFSEFYCQWVIEDQAKCVGFAVVRKIMDHWELLQMVIERDAQGKGFATQLLNHLIVEAKKEFIRIIQLEVRHSNAAARALYQKCGFVDVGVRKKYYSDGEDAVLMDWVSSGNGHSEIYNTEPER